MLLTVHVLPRTGVRDVERARHGQQDGVVEALVQARIRGAHFTDDAALLKM